MKILSLLKDFDTLHKKNWDFDVVIIGSGAGGGLSAYLLDQYGYRVLLLEHGPFIKTADLSQNEAEAYPSLYQEAAARKTSDGAINILQGRNLGGSTTVNWTSSFRTPPGTLKYWREGFGLDGFHEEGLKEYFEECEKLLNIGPWDIPANRNNEILAEGLQRKGLKVGSIGRNVHNCQNLGFCGLGCPTGAKQSSLQALISKTKNVTVIADAFVESLSLDRGRSRGEALNIYPRGERSKRWRLPVKELIVSGGAINSPALLMRSSLPDPYHHLGKRTFLHPVVLSGALFKEKVEAYYGAPQVFYSDEFMSENPHELGFKIEVPPIHPLLLASVLPFAGDQHRSLMQALPHLHAMISLQRDGFHEESPGGQVSVDREGRAHLDYRPTQYMKKGFRRALLKMGELQFAAGAKEVLPIHRHSKRHSSFKELKEGIQKLSMEPHDLTIVSAHVMGGCSMGRRKEEGVVDSQGRHHQIENLSVFDGSIFPTSIGTNPMLSIYALTYKLCAEKFGKG